MRREEGGGRREEERRREERRRGGPSVHCLSNFYLAFFYCFHFIFEIYFFSQQQYLINKCTCKWEGEAVNVSICYFL